MVQDQRTLRAATAPQWSPLRAYRIGEFVRLDGELYVSARDVPAHFKPVMGGKHFWRHLPRAAGRRK